MGSHSAEVSSEEIKNQKVAGNEYGIRRKKQSHQQPATRYPPQRRKAQVNPILTSQN
jgi:hypothetical protein